VRQEAAAVLCRCCSSSSPPCRRWSPPCSCCSTEEYFALLDAPHKELIWFEDSAHTPMWAEPERFTEVLVTNVLTDTYPQMADSQARAEPVRWNQNSRQSAIAYTEERLGVEVHPATMRRPKKASSRASKNSIARRLHCQMRAPL
jgi:hypothetical protein